MIRVDRGFFLYGLVTVEYDGRAQSTVGPSNFVIMHKTDGTLIIHGNYRVTPVNYQRPGSSLTYENGVLLCKSKKEDEQIKITIHKLKQYYEMPDWSTDKIAITRTESELCERIIRNIHKVIGHREAEIHRELRTRYGPIDIVAIDSSDHYHIIEVKRRKATVNDVFQVKKYTEALSDKDHTAYLVAPDISPKAHDLTDELGVYYCQFRHA